MKAIGRNLIISKEKQGTSSTKESDNIYYDSSAGHNVEIDKTIYQVIKLQDVVIVV